MPWNRALQRRAGGGAPQRRILPVRPRQGADGRRRRHLGGSIYLRSIREDHAIYDGTHSTQTQSDQSKLCTYYAPPSISELGGGPLTV